MNLADADAAGANVLSAILELLLGPLGEGIRDDECSSSSLSGSLPVADAGLSSLRPRISVLPSQIITYDLPSSRIDLITPLADHRPEM